MKIKSIALASILLFSNLVMAENPIVELQIQASKDVFFGTIGAIKLGAANYRAYEIVKNGPPGKFPSSLDSQADGVCTACFVEVLSTAINSTDWVKKGNHYTYTKGSFKGEFDYDPTTGEVKSNPAQ